MKFSFLKSNKLRYVMSHMGNLKLNQPLNLIFDYLADC